MAVEAHPALADHLIGLVGVVQALKLKLGIQLRPVTLYYVCARLQAKLHSHSVTSLHFNHGGMRFILWLHDHSFKHKNVTNFLLEL